MPAGAPSQQAGQVRAISSSDTPTASPAASVAATASASTSPTVAATSEPAVKVGLMAPFSGVASGFGLDMLKGAQMAVDEANGSGGKRLAIDQGDDMADPTVAANVAQKLTGDGVVAVVGPATSASALAVGQAFNQAKIPSITPASNDPRITDQGLTFLFRASGRWDEEPAALANAIGASKTALIADKSTYGQALAAAERQTLGSNRPVVDEAVDSGTKDWTAIVDKVRAGSPDALLFAGYGQDGGGLAKALASAGVKPKLFMGDAAQDQALLTVGGSDVDGLQFVAAPDPSKAAPAFADAFKKRYGTPASAYAASTYDTVRLLADALRRANGAGGDGLRSALAASQFAGAYWGKMTFDTKGDLQSKTYVLWSVTGGKFVPV